MKAFAGDGERDEFAAQQRHRELDGQRELNRLRQGIDLRGLAFAHDPAPGDVLHDISLAIRARTSVALVGESGAGRSTLGGSVGPAAAPQQRPDPDRWYAGQRDSPGLPGVVRLATFPRRAWFSTDTLANNSICRWQGDISWNRVLLERVRDAARRAHIAHFIEELPEGFQTLVGDRGLRLCGGQRYRLFIARELFKQPNVLILEETTSARQPIRALY